MKWSRKFFTALPQKFLSNKNMQEFKRILKQNRLKYFLFALLITILSCMYIRYGQAIRPCGSEICHFEWDLISFDPHINRSQYPISLGGLPIPYMFSGDACSSSDIFQTMNLYGVFFLDIFLWILIFTSIHYFKEKCKNNETKEQIYPLLSFHKPK